jgi:hypothetical protein
MTTKIASFFITLVINVAFGAVIFFFMLIAMNGFSESDATYGLGTYIALAFAVSLLMSGSAVFVVHALTGRGFKAITAVLIAVPIFSLLGAALKIVCSIIGVSVAEYVRVNY